MFYGCAENEYSEGREPMLFNAVIGSRMQTRVIADTSKTNNGNLIVRSSELSKGITESVSKMTRATVDGNWGTGGYIAVQDGGTIKQYTIDSSGNVTSSSPFYWESKANISVTSWYPYSASKPTSWTVNSNQSTAANYNGSDLLYASNTFTYSGGSGNKLQYTHETAKVVINILKADGLITSSDISSVTIGTLSSPIIMSGTVNSNGSITASTTTGYIIPYKTTSSTYVATYSALVIPQDMNEKQFIAIKMTNGSNYYYKPSTLTKLLGGYEYDYNITVPYVNVGDYYYSDGTWGTSASPSGKTVIGVIFSNSTSNTDKSHGWTHGYAMAIKDAARGVNWGTYGVDTPLSNGLDMSNMDGYTETQTIKNTYAPLSTSNYPAFYYALNYGVTAPNSSSGWFLPSCGQWYQIAITLGGRSSGQTTWTDQATATVNSINNYLNNVSGSELFYYDTSINYWFWSSSEEDVSVCKIFQMDLNEALINGAIKNLLSTNNTDTYQGQVRPAIAF